MLNLVDGARGDDDLLANGIIVDPGAPAFNTAPGVTITAPTDGSSFANGSSISFAATANDAEDGDLSANLTWTSSIDGILGNGVAVSPAGDFAVAFQGRGADDAQSVFVRRFSAFRANGTPNLQKLVFATSFFVLVLLLVLESRSTRTRRRTRARTI